MIRKLFPIPDRSSRSRICPSWPRHEIRPCPKEATVAFLSLLSYLHSHYPQTVNWEALRVRTLAQLQPGGPRPTPETRAVLHLRSGGDAVARGPLGYVVVRKRLGAVELAQPPGLLGVVVTGLFWLWRKRWAEQRRSLFACWLDPVGVAVTPPRGRDRPRGRGLPECSGGGLTTLFSLIRCRGRGRAAGMEGDSLSRSQDSLLA